MEESAMDDSVKRHEELESLPGWARKMIGALATSAGCGYNNGEDHLKNGMREPDDYAVVHLILKKDALFDWLEGIEHMERLAGKPRHSGPDLTLLRREIRAKLFSEPRQQ
jgi:hypothetical protein